MRTSNDDNYTAVEAIVKVMTKKAALLIIDEDEHWVPFSCIFEDDLAEMGVGVCMEVNIKEWFYEKEIA